MIAAAEPSRTAQRVALRRAAHQLLDRPPVLSDPLAIPILGPALPEALAAAGFDAGAGAFFAWLGVTQYLTPETIRATLGYVAGATRAGGGVVFDYAVAPDLLSPAQRAVRAALERAVGAAGEPWRSAFAPGALVAELRGLGFAVAEDVAPDEINGRYLAARRDGLRVGGMSRLMWAGATPHA